MIGAEEGGDTAELNMKHAAGIFFILIGGVILSMIIAGLERLYRKNPSCSNLNGKKKEANADTKEASDQEKAAMV